MVPPPLLMKIPTLLFSLLLAPLALAEPEWASLLNVKGPGPYLPTKPVTLSYSLSYNGRVSAGHASIRLGYKDPRYPKHVLAQSYGSTTGFARRLFRFDFNFTSFLTPKTFKPQVFVAEETEKSEHKRTETRYNSKRVQTTRTKTEDGKSKTSNQTFNFPNVLDAQSAVIWVRSLDMKQGQQAYFVVMPFKTPYLCRVTHTGTEVVSTRRCIKYELAMQRINRDTLALESYDKLKSFNIWITDDRERLPLEFRSKLFIGDVRAVLTSREYGS